MSQSPPDGFGDEFSPGQLDNMSQHAKDAADATARQAQAAANLAAAMSYIKNQYGHGGSMTVHLYGAGGNGGAGGGNGGAGGGNNSNQVSGAGYSCGGGGGGGSWASAAPIQLTPGPVYTVGGHGGSGGSSKPFRPRPQRGADGFDGAGMAIGTVRGYRWWSLSAPDLSMNPSDAELWVPDWLRGARSIEWTPGENEAVCTNLGAHDPDLIPLLECGCGFWSYWHRKPPSVSGPILVQGVIEGYGNVLTGPLGSRCSKARILALSLGSRVEAVLQAASYTGLLQRHLPNSKIYGYGDQGIYQPVGNDTPEHMQARQQAEAWTAIISDRLSVMYPEAEVYENEKLMYLTYPPDPQYADLDTCTCGYTGPGPYHTMFCPMA